MTSKSGGVVAGPLTLVALAALAWVVIAVTLAALAPPAYVPHIFHSSHVEHLAAFYIVTLIAAAGFVRLSLFRLAAVMIGFAVVLAAIRAFQPAHQLSGAEDLLCDIAGVWAAIAPVMVGRLRDRREAETVRFGRRDDLSDERIEAAPADLL